MATLLQSLPKTAVIWTQVDARIGRSRFEAAGLLELLTPRS